MYMQFMDDLEDMYEDRAEQRQSPIAGLLHAIRQANQDFTSAIRDLAQHYGRDPAAHDWQLFQAG